MLDIYEFFPSIFYQLFYIFVFIIDIFYFFCIFLIYYNLYEKSFLFNRSPSLLFLFFSFFLFLLHTVLQMFLKQHSSKHFLTILTWNKIKSNFFLIRGRFELINISFLLLTILVVFFNCFNGCSEILGSSFPIITGFLESFSFTKLIFLFSFVLFH